jgi:hypothetical protein
MRLVNKITIATIILHNILIMWGDVEPPADDDEDDDGIDDLVLTERSVCPNCCMHRDS